LIRAFFGLSPNYKPVLHTQIFELVYYGRGGFNWTDIYNMPIWLRKFYYKKIEDAVQQEKKATESKTKSMPRVAKPSIAPR
jgi:hypothetical protein